MFQKEEDTLASSAELNMLCLPRDGGDGFPQCCLRECHQHDTRSRTIFQQFLLGEMVNQVKELITTFIILFAAFAVSKARYALNGYGTFSNYRLVGYGDKAVGESAERLDLQERVVAIAGNLLEALAT